MSLSSIPPHLRSRVLARDGDRCQYCGLSQHGQAAAFHIDHVVPRSRGGLTEENNLALQCPHCSLRKSNKLSVMDPVTGQEIEIFHPLLQQWSEHFTLDEEGLLTGTTAVGRATVDALAMNDLRPSAARAFQLSLGIIEVSG